jgi:hypothetical protein
VVKVLCQLVAPWSGRRNADTVLTRQHYTKQIRAAMDMRIVIERMTALDITFRL